jgi:PAS domain S-box-containing protein
MPSQSQPEVALARKPAAADQQPADLRHPLRFVWQLDAELHFTITAAEFIALVGPSTTAVLGRPWPEIAATLGLDPDEQIARALATRDTWSGLQVNWPVDGSVHPVTVELSGLPVFDRDRVFRGYRGFGVCRDVTRLNALMETRRRAAAAASDDQPSTDAAPTAENVVRFPGPQASGEAGVPTLSPLERHAFHELSRRLANRINDVDQADHAPDPQHQADVAAGSEPHFDVPDVSVRDDAGEDADSLEIGDFLDRLPIGVLVYRLNHLLYANRAFLQWAGHQDLDALVEAGGIDSLPVEPRPLIAEGASRAAFTIASTRTDADHAEGHLLQVAWDGEPAFALVTMPRAEAGAPGADATGQARSEVEELKAALEIAADGIVVVDPDARVVSSNRGAQALFGYDVATLAGMTLFDLLAPEGADVARDWFQSRRKNRTAGDPDDGREIVGCNQAGGRMALFMTLGRLNQEGSRFCAVFREIPAWKQAEADLIAAKRRAEQASSAKSEFLARISHEIRTPLNAIIGFSEIMMDERFGPVGNDRYRQYLKDIHTSGGHLISLINDLLDLSKVEAGKIELTFTSLSINDLIQQCVAIMQPQAHRERIIIRTALSPKLPQIVVDARSMRQIMLNLLSNSIKFTGAGGQVIVSSALTDRGDVVLRVRDSGVGMSERDIETAMEPFRQLATSTRFGSGGTGLGLPLSKALAEANRAQFAITSKPNAGTLVEVTFPATRVAAAE